MPAFLLPLLLNLAPTVASWVLGDKTGKAVDQVAGIIKETTGIDGDPADALSANPELVLRLKEALIRAESEERQRQHDEVMARLADVASARQHTVDLAKSGSPIAWGAVVISALVIGGFALLMWYVIRQEIPAAQREMVGQLLFLVAGMASSVVAYWVGSSAGSAQKTNAIEKVLTSR